MKITDQKAMLEKTLKMDAQVNEVVKELKDTTDTLDGTTIKTEENTVTINWGPYTKIMTKEEFLALTDK